MFQCYFVIVAVLLPLQGLADFAEQVTHALPVPCRLTLPSTKCPDDENIIFHLYTRKNQKGSQIVKVNKSKDNIEKTHFNPDHPNKVIIHGFKPFPYKSQLTAIKDAYLSKGEFNVWMIEWDHLAANGLCLLLSLTNTEHVGMCTAQLINAIKRHAPNSHIHVVAYRAGVRVAHDLSEAIRPLTLNRITGLSPKGGKIPTGEDFYKLDFWDADFIDTIHTSWYLTTEQIGHVDFYVNPNLSHQPGCDNVVGSITKCDRMRALQYFAESITTEVGFIAWRCQSYAEYTLGTCHPHEPAMDMGESCPIDGSGVYIVFTAKESPYALGHWDEELYKEKGPQMKFNILTKSLTNIKTKIEGIREKIEEIDEKTPDIIKELGLTDMVKSTIEDKVEEYAMKGFKALANALEKKHKDVGGVTPIPDIVDKKE
ncbi:pancreatic lipase-related protein 2-like [Macrosteles quadrilineatus]|uniref:pancreatic lipase-related protein 2-like n=1 Tax=Macrosteles quadrilineatus TaxID=74068 RepID=UPI0023E23661|nr:pancreatic lipase-related protein 2-like [Macrosteles quadrilineatus]